MQNYIKNIILFNNNIIKKIFKTHKEIVNDFMWRGLQVIGKQGITFLIFFLCAKLLNQYDFGVYNYTLTIVFVLIMFGDFGISTATSKYVAEYNIFNKEKLRSILFNSSIIIFGLTILMSILTIVFGHYYFNDKFIYICYLLPLIFLAPMTSLYDGIYRGLKKFKQLAIISLSVGSVSIFFVYFLINSYGLLGALMSQNIFYLLLLIALGFGYKDFNFKLNKEVIRDISKYSFIIGSVSALYFLFTRVTTLILGHYSLFSAISYYELITKIILFILLPFNIFAQILGPKIILFKKEYAVSSLRKITVTSLIIGLLLFIIVNTILPLIIKIFLPNYYIFDFIKILRIYSFILLTQGAVIIASNGFATYLGHANLNLKLLFILFPINIIGAMLIIPKYGLFYFMIFFTIVQVISDLLYLYLIKKIISIKFVN